MVRRGPAPERGDKSQHGYHRDLLRGQEPSRPAAESSMIASQRALLIAVVGGSGAGKGWFVDRLCRVLGDEACHLELDAFYRDLSHLPMRLRARQNFDIPDAIDWP